MINEITFWVAIILLLLGMAIAIVNLITVYTRTPHDSVTESPLAGVWFGVFLLIVAGAIALIVVGIQIF